MSAHKASLINGIVLIAIGLLGVAMSSTFSPTSLIPVVFGAILLALNGGVKRENKVIAHIAVVLTLLILLALVMPLKGAISGERTMAMVRILIMQASSLYAMIYFIKSFKEARKNKG